ncbi:MAG: ADP-ribosylglycohydrolase family protein [Verrucomicrobiia bacterium]
MPVEKKPTWNCYWLQPGRVMVGEYPSSRALANTREKLREFLNAGFSCFIDLTEEGELHPYSDVLKDEAKKMGIDVMYIRIPIRDVGIPTREYMIKILDAIDKAASDNRLVYVHCRGGIGRTAIVAGCFLVRHGMSGEQALEALHHFLEEVEPGDVVPRAPGTYEQQYFIKNWKEKDEPDEEFIPANEEPSARLKRYIGCLVGLATGDSLGVATESLPPGRFKPVTDLLGGGEYNLKPGEWTDDTSMALCIATSLVENKGFNIQDQLLRLINWRDRGYMSSTGSCIGIKYSITRALHYFQQTGKTAIDIYDQHSANNSSLVRMAPIAMLFRNSPEDAIRFAAVNCQSTHSSKTAIDACKYFTGLLIGALSGYKKTAILSELFAPVNGLWKKEPLQPAIEIIALGSFKRRYPPTIKTTDYVVDSLEAALWAFYRGSNFKDGALLLANLGDDACAACAIYGQLAGAFYGAEDIPGEWISKVAMRPTIENLAKQLFQLSEPSVS